MTEPQEAQATSFGIDYVKPDRSLKPLIFLADSQLLFWKGDGTPFMRTVAALLDSDTPRAAYVGASNGDDPAYYAIFEAAMDEAGIAERRMIPTEPGPDDLDFLDRAHLVLLAGGEVERGWRAFTENGLKQILYRRYYEGALIMGLSAGAVQLGLGGWGEQGRPIDTFRLVPHVIGVHEEEESWEPLKGLVRHYGEHVYGFGIPAGGGFIYHSDHSIQPLRRPLIEMRLAGGEVHQGFVVPGDEDADEEAELEAVAPAEGGADPIN